MSNMISRRFPIVGATVAILALDAGFASAQTPAPQLTSLHDALHLAADQEPAWRAYVGAISPDPESQARRRAAAEMMANLPTPRRVDLIDAQVDADTAALHRQGRAVKAFYAALTPEQQATFDRETAQGGSAASSLRQPGRGAPLPAPGRP